MLNWYNGYILYRITKTWLFTKETLCINFFLFRFIFSLVHRFYSIQNVAEFWLERSKGVQCYNRLPFKTVCLFAQTFLEHFRSFVTFFRPKTVRNVERMETFLMYMVNVRKITFKNWRINCNIFQKIRESFMIFSRKKEP